MAGRGGSEPTAVLEPVVWRDGGDDHEHQREGISEEPSQFRHVLEVHAVDGADQGRWQEQHGHPQAWLDSAVWGRRPDMVAKAETGTHLRR